MWKGGDAARVACCHVGAALTALRCGPGSGRWQARSILTCSGPPHCPLHRLAAAAGGRPLCRAAALAAGAGGRLGGGCHRQHGGGDAARAGEWLLGKLVGRCWGGGCITVLCLAELRQRPARPPILAVQCSLPCPFFAPLCVPCAAGDAHLWAVQHGGGQRCLHGAGPAGNLLSHLQARGAPLF